MAPKSTQQNANGGFKKNVLGPMVGSVLSGAINATPSTQQTAGSSTRAVKGGASTEESASGEIELQAKLPLIAAITALGGPEALLAATELSLVVTKFPKGTSTTVSR